MDEQTFYAKRTATDLEAMKHHKSVPVAYLLWFFLGVLGVHRFYMRNPWLGVIQLLTGCGFGVWWFIDLFLIPGRIRRINDDITNEFRQANGVL